ncbi:unnamed protein product [Polarella glacialis]|uniref:UBA domain-containing protein n=1 Tax=Polarella glacialis TaxID=89957 RepID=A0A813L871_POLGL|nr:unnamed protein product [Polarella glacialis]
MAGVSLDASLAQLVEMGFSAEAASSSLLAVEGNLEAALQRFFVAVRDIFYLFVACFVVVCCCFMIFSILF